MEINFYQSDEGTTKSIAPLILKILEENKKVLIFSRDPARIKEVDDGLWSYGKNKFIPHITIADTNFVLTRQPVLITNKEENSNQADYIILLEEASQNFVLGFSRAFYFFDSLTLEKARKVALNYQKNAKINSYKKEESKWVRSNL